MANLITCNLYLLTPESTYSRTGKVRLMAKNIGFRMELLGTPKVRLGVPA